MLLYMEGINLNLFWSMSNMLESNRVYGISYIMLKLLLCHTQAKNIINTSPVIICPISLGLTSDRFRGLVHSRQPEHGPFQKQKRKDHHHTYPGLYALFLLE